LEYKASVFTIPPRNRFIHPCEKRIIILGGDAWQHFLWLVANLKQ
jgi:hypothetical protein